MELFVSNEWSSNIDSSLQGAPKAAKDSELEINHLSANVGVVGMTLTGSDRRP